MRIIIIVFLPALMLLIIFGSCTYSNVVEVVPVNDSNVVMSANASGLSYIAYDGNFYLGSNTLQLHAFTKNNRVIDLFIHNYLFYNLILTKNSARRSFSKG